jgi:hypothetical protein
VRGAPDLPGRSDRAPRRWDREHQRGWAGTWRRCERGVAAGIGGDAVAGCQLPAAGPGDPTCEIAASASAGERLTRGFVFASSAAYSSPRRPAGSDGHRSVAGPGVAQPRVTRAATSVVGVSVVRGGRDRSRLTPSTRLGRFERLPRERAGRLLSVRARSLRTQQRAKSQCQKPRPGTGADDPFRVASNRPRRRFLWYRQDNLVIMLVTSLCA